MEMNSQVKATLIATMLVCSSLVAIVGLSPRSVSAPATSLAGWIPQDSGVTENLNSVQFVCLNRGAIAGDMGTILDTGDGGDNWIIQTSGVQVNLNDISYFMYSVAVAVGEAGTILFTTDGGMNWTIKQTDMMGSYKAAQMINETFGVAVGVNAIFQPFFTRTDDGWETWDSTSFYIEHESTMYEGKLSDVVFLNSTHGFATAIVDIPTGGAIARTTDGGNTWETVYFSTTPLYGIDFTQSGIGYAVGESGAILQSTDGGQTWNAQESGVTKPLNAVDFPSDQVGYAVGDRGIILRTSDGGQTWTAQSSGVTNILKAVSFMGEPFGAVVGEGGIILHTTTGGMEEDFWPPETTCTLDGTMDGDVYISNVTVTLTAIDNLSGVSDTSYSLDNGSWMPYTEPFVVSDNGDHLILFHSTDNAGNMEEDKSASFTIEKQTLAVSIEGGLGIHVTVKNNGAGNITAKPWNLTLTGGLIFFGQSVSGEVTLGPGEETVLKDFVIGIGRPQVAFTLGSTTTTVDASVFLFFVNI